MIVIPFIEQDMHNSRQKNNYHYFKRVILSYTIFFNQRTSFTSLKM